ncbi:rRNA methyltransferase 3, mitochondrial [Diabrotica virgifera virgifera]|uniref:rRNA methyltransferase 3, mitochondrial n=1 Tax=Diabrotica virgifera virgifera TaxID=50390 RepID=A0A6P7GJE4_DIAVI|nr:rRNA methyltransferase 3, mitochondrial [Diabrotica virgifera virgifera]
MFNKLKILVFSDTCLSINQQSRCLARWSSRKPAKLIAAEEYDEEADKHLPKDKPAWSVNYFKNKSLENNRSKDIEPITISKKGMSPKITMDMLESTTDENGDFIYTKMKNNDPRISQLLTEIKSNKERDKRDLMLLEGKRLIKDALDAKCKLQYILFSRFDEVDYLKPSIPKIGAKLYKMPLKEMQMWSDLTTCPGIMGIFKIPDVASHSVPKGALPLTIVCDNIREADNLGAILRTSSGVGCEQVLLTKGCVNVWDSKVLRSACGAHFKLKIKKKVDMDTIIEDLPPNCNFFIADNKVISMTSIDENQDKKLLSKLLESIPIVPYYGLNFTPNKHNVLIVGGETEGISLNSYSLVSNLNGVRLNIPLGNNVDSLNVGTALGILVFEMKRQYLSKIQNDTSDCVKGEVV